jgi:integrase
LVIANPALGVDAPSVPFKAPEIHSPEQVAQVLECARTLDANLCRFMAIRYFAGLRGSEAAALSESEIKVDRGFIEVTAAKSKTRQRRLVAIEPNLVAWLALGGSLPLRDKWTRHLRLAKSCSVPMPANVTRHSFVSYHLAHFGSAARTALEAGHSEAVLFRHYREVVTRDDARRFWEIRPK